MTWILTLILWFSATGLTLDNRPQFKGGDGNLNRFISQNLVYPEYARQNCLQGSVQISFKLNSQGKIASSRVHKGFGLDLDDEALRIVRLTSGRWQVPASFDTTNAIIIPINFILKENNCDQRDSEDIKAAIVAYRLTQSMTRGIKNYYHKKSTGTYVAEEEAKINDLKFQLGYNDRYFNRVLDQAKQKLKQGDKESACEDFHHIRLLGSDKSKKYINQYCR
jgi:TonB family protein